MKTSLLDWQPLQTAPKDGTWFLVYDLKHLWRDRAPVAVVRYIPDQAFPVDRNGFVYSNITHWLPLPPRPNNENNPLST